MTDRELDKIADRIAARLLAHLGSVGAEPVAAAKLVDAAELARLLGVARSYVYAHAAELGGVRIGKGPKAPWRFARELPHGGYRRHDDEQRDDEPAVKPRRRAPAPKAGSILRNRGAERTRAA